MENISSCGPQKSTVIVSFLRLLRTDHNKKVKPPVSHAPISEETAFRKIYFILPMQKPSLNVSHKELFSSCVAFARHTCFLYCEIVLAERLYCKKFLCFVFASILQSDHHIKSVHRTVTAISHCQHSHNVIHSFRSSTK